MKAFMMTTAAVMLAATAVMASTAEKRIPTLKVGKCAITLLDSNGIKPLDGANLLLTNAEDGKAAVKAVANKSGLCEITVAEGRYLLSINEKPVTLINAAKDGQMAWARIVFSDSPMMVGGQEGATAVTYTFMGMTYTKAALIAAVGLGTIAATAVVIEETRDENDNVISSTAVSAEQVINRPRPASN